MRKYVIAGNWKMNKTPAEATALINDLKPLVAGASCDVVVGVPFVDLPAALEATKGTAIGVAAQNCHWEKSGAFTGEVSAEMLKAMEVGYVILGHSERRTYFGDTDVTVQKRVRAALGCRPDRHSLRGRIPGEAGAGRHRRGGGHGRPKSPWAASPPRSWPASSSRMSPVWAIGTGRTATAAQANEVCALIRDTVAQLYSWEIADDLVIQYGGSMNAGNAAELLAQPDVDGGLIGGASLKPDQFVDIINAANQE